MQGGFADGENAAVIPGRHELGRPQREVGQPEEGVMAQLERRRPGVAGLADERALPVVLAGDPFDDADRNALVLEDRSLFDMELEIGLEVRPVLMGGQDAVRGEAGLLQDVAEKAGRTTSGRSGPPSRREAP